MLLKEILLDANMLVPNSINEEIKVRWLNQIQRQLYRDFSFPDTSHAFLAEAGTSLYQLPENASQERITNVTVNGETYDYKTVNDEAEHGSWTTIDGMLWIYPTPTQNVQAYISYRPRPRDMRIEMAEESPEFPEDFHEVLVLGLGLRIARSNGDSKRTAELNENFLIMHDEAKRKLRFPKQRRVKTSKSWR